VSARLVQAAVASLCACLTLVGGAAVRAQDVADSGHLVIVVAGDVLPESNWQASRDASHLFEGVQDEFARADLVFVNLEEPITRSNQVTPHKNPAAVKAGLDYILRARNPLLPRIFEDSGIGLVGLANNHMMDYTVTGLSDTLAGFKRVKLPVVGAGLKRDAERAHVFEKGGVRVALLAFTDVVPPHSQATVDRPGVASSKRLADLTDAVWDARRRADFVVLMMHWGGQGNHLITKRQQQVARVAVRAGCDVVVGMHPHVLQGIEYIGRVPVFYSIGNFAFPSSNPPNRECVMVKLTFSPKELTGLELIPVEISPSGAPKVTEGTKGDEILAHLDGFCRMFNTRIEAGLLAGSNVREPLVYDTKTRGSGRRRVSRQRRRRSSLGPPLVQ
jgi:poly-gamma-glutamate capsule biosynthesis protein CapA/YwtB (metallophosphatase superfamily)